MSVLILTIRLCRKSVPDACENPALSALQHIVATTVLALETWIQVGYERQQQRLETSNHPFYH